jgi:hypothetical protein
MTAQERAKDTRLRREFHTNLEEWNRVYEYQGRCCAICKRSVNKKGMKLILATDHCHTSGLLRGLLCWQCNKAIAIFNDNLDRLRNAVLYFEHNPYTVALGKEVFTAPGRVGTKARIKQLAVFNAARGETSGKEKTKQRRRKSRKK